MSYNELWARALSYALNKRMPENRAYQFAHEYAHALDALSQDDDCGVLTPEQFDHLVKPDDEQPEWERIEQ